MRRLAIGSLAIAMAACGGDTPTAPDDTRSQQVGSEVDAEESGRKVAQAIAAALGDASTRSKLLAAWRDSRESSDHKLDFHAFVESPIGEELVQAAGKSLAVSSTELRPLIERLPRLDFYIPIRAHRNSWRGTPDILVAYVSNQEADTVIAFDVNGQGHVIEGRSASNGRPLVVLHPAEPRVQARLPFGTPENSEVIEPVGQLRRVLENSTATLSGYPGAPFRSLVTTGLYITYFDSFRDDGWFGGDLEMEFKLYQTAGGYTYNSGSALYWLLPAYSDGLVTTTANLPHQPPVNVNILVYPSMDWTLLSTGCCGGIYSTPGLLVIAWEGDAGTYDDFGQRVWGQGSFPPYALGISSTSVGYDYFSKPGTTSGTKSLHMALQLQ